MTTPKNIIDITYEELHKKADESLVQTFTEKLLLLKENNQDTCKIVDDVLPFLQGEPKMIDILVIGYLVNNGILLRADEKEEEIDPSFLQEMEEFGKDWGD